MSRSFVACAFVVIASIPFAIFVGCGDDATTTVPPGATTPDGAVKNRDGASTTDVEVLPVEDSGPVRCSPASSLAPDVPTAPLAGSVGGSALPAPPKSYARPIASLPGFYEVDFSEGEASCTNADGGTRGLRIVVASNGERCSSTDPTRAEFYRKTGTPYTRPAGTEGVVVAKPSGSQLEVGVIVGALPDNGLPGDVVTGTTKVPICP